VQNYRRELDLTTAVANVRYEHHGVNYTRKVFASHRDNVLVIQLESSVATKYTLRLTRVSEHEYETNEFVDSIAAEANGIIMHATPGGFGSNRLCCVAKVLVHDGAVVEAIGNCLVVTSRKTTIIVSAQTTFRHTVAESAALEDVELASKYHDLRDRHIKDYQSLFQRMQLCLYPDDQGPLTDERLLGRPDPGLVALYHNYGRYLLIACSRPGFKALPATLQGLWNPSFQPAWGSKYTININTQMNYWPANVTNLAECELPLFDLLERMAERGKKTAKVMYGCRGWAAHHNTDIWADTNPQDRWMPATGELNLHIRSII
jgi:Glycosyl hydrolase family 95 catalytic domain/Glycosyl hydrolase family 65, N-terminal domain